MPHEIKLVTNCTNALSIQRLPDGNWSTIDPALIINIYKLSQDLLKLKTDKGMRVCTELTEVALVESI